MVRYIDAEELTEEITSLSVMLGGEDVFKTAKKSILRIIDEQPTADVAEVVRCKDCEWSVERVTNNEIFPYQCLNTTACGKPRRALDFCSYGERS